MKTVVKIILLFGVLGYLIFAVCSLSGDEDTRVCRGTKIMILDNDTSGFIDTAFVARLLKQSKKDVTGIPVKNVDAAFIEDFIRKSPYLDSVMCYYTSDNVLCIQVMPRHPILHVISNTGESYYMDINGNHMPTDLFALDLCLATGNISKKFAKDKLLHIATFLNTHEPWDREIQQICVRDTNHLELIPMTGNHTIILGEPANIEEKMNKLSIFYKEGLDKAGWNKYKTIDLNYANQVVCTKRK